MLTLLTGTETGIRGACRWWHAQQRPVPELSRDCARDLQLHADVHSDLLTQLQHKEGRQPSHRPDSANSAACVALLADAFWYAWQTILIVLLIVLGGPWWVWRVVLYIRKKANAPMDLELLLCGLLAAIDVLSAVLVMVLLVVSDAGAGWSVQGGVAMAAARGVVTRHMLCWVHFAQHCNCRHCYRCCLHSCLQVSVYWLVLYKLQEGVLLLMLPDDQLYNFWVTVVLAMVGQSVGLLQMLYQQIRCVLAAYAWHGTCV